MWHRKGDRTMTNKELITKLLDFPMDAEIRIDMHPKFNQSMPKEVGWDDDKERVWITNYK